MTHDPRSRTLALLHPTLFASLLVLPACSKSAYELFEIGAATGDLENWLSSDMIVCQGSSVDGDIILAGEAKDYNAEGHDAYVVGVAVPWPAELDTNVEVAVSVYVTTVADSANGGSGTATIALGPMLPEAVGNEPSETRWRELSVRHLEFPAQSLEGMFAPIPLDASTLTDGFFYCEDLEASLANQLDTATD